MMINDNGNACTCGQVVENLSESATVDSVVKDFAVAGAVEHVRMLRLKKMPLPPDIAAYMNVVSPKHCSYKYICMGVCV